MPQRPIDRLSRADRETVARLLEAPAPDLATWLERKDKRPYRVSDRLAILAMWGRQQGVALARFYAAHAPWLLIPYPVAPEPEYPKVLAVTTEPRSTRWDR